MQNINLTDHFLIAMPALEDPYFSRALIYIAEHNEQGALGLIVNRQIEINLATLALLMIVALLAGAYDWLLTTLGSTASGILFAACAIAAPVIAALSGRKPLDTQRTDQ